VDTSSRVYTDSNVDTSSRVYTDSNVDTGSNAHTDSNAWQTAWQSGFRCAVSTTFTEWQRDDAGDHPTQRAQPGQHAGLGQPGFNTDFGE
jgi:hypothetical protein